MGDFGAIPKQGWHGFFPNGGFIAFLLLYHF
jgi:hypothetical protein